MTVADLKKYEDSCYSALSRDLTEFEKNFLFISSGLLAFSTTFIKDTIKVSEIMCLPVLFIGWFFMISSIALMMYAFLRSASASDMLLNTVTEFEIENQLFDESIVLSEGQSLVIKNSVSKILKKSKSNLKVSRNLAVTLFLFGLLALSLFISLNLIAEKNRSKLKGKSMVTVSYKHHNNNNNKFL